MDFYNLNETELAAVAGKSVILRRPDIVDALFAEALTILLEFYGAQDTSAMEYLNSIASVST